MATRLFTGRERFAAFRTLLVTALLILGSASAFAIEVPDGAYATGAVDEGEPRAETRLIVDRDTIAPGESFRVGVLFDLDDHWHVYGEDPGDAGMPTYIEWRGEPAAFGDVEWPPTETFLDPAGVIETKGYGERVVLQATATAPADATGTVELSAEIDYLACRVKCLPGSAVLKRTLPVGESKAAASAVLDAFETFGPKRKPLSADTIQVVPSKKEAASVAAAESRSDPPKTVTANAPSPAEALPLWQILLLALLGGVLLNLMPCVFPVLALKVFGFVTGGGHDRRTALMHSGVYAAGILVSMLVLAGVVLAVQWTGSHVGWGFQFQEPGYLIGLTLVVTLFALNLFGLFDVPLLPIPSRATTGEATLGRSFVDGGLAVVLATPCSAPFLGTAVGFALTSSPLTIVSTFVAIGVGLAAPFVVASAIPKVGKWLPKPGAWMESFERVLGFILLGTAVWLVWVFGRVAGVDGIARLLAATLIAAFGAWVWGKLQYGERRKRFIGVSVLTGSIVIGLVAFSPWNAEPPQAGGAAKAAGWVQWDRDQIAIEQSQGRVVFVDFTADWCITCKVNERTVLKTPEVQATFAEANVVPMLADWTRRDEKIRAELARHGRAGVPMYLVYPAGGGEPEVLPELLTVDIVNAAIDRGLRDR